MPNNLPTHTATKHRILLVDTCPCSTISLADKLKSQNESPLAVLDSMRGVIAAIEKIRPSIVLFDVHALEDDILETLNLIKQKAPLPTLVFAKTLVPGSFESAVEVGVSAYIVDEVSADRLVDILDLAHARFSHDIRIRLELEETKAKLDARKVIEKAKGIIMNQKNISEDKAYTQLRRSAMNQGRSMADLAENLILSADPRN